MFCSLSIVAMSFCTTVLFLSPCWKWVYITVRCKDIHNFLTHKRDIVFVALDSVSNVVDISLKSECYWLPDSLTLGSKVNAIGRKPIEFGDQSQ